MILNSSTSRLQKISQCYPRSVNVASLQYGSSKGGKRMLAFANFFPCQRVNINSKYAYAIPLKVLKTHTKSGPKSLSVEASIEALIFDCDGVILESENLHRSAYNATFMNFGVVCPGEDSPVSWSTEFYDVLQNKIGGGKPKMRWYFNEVGWPSSVLSTEIPATEGGRDRLIDALQDWKTAKYKEMIASGKVPARPGVIKMMDEARKKGLKVAVCSAATKSSVEFVLTNLIGKKRFAALDCFLAGDDVDKKKPDPTIYNVASKALGIEPSKCLVVEDSTIGLQAALGAGMRCIITYTSSTKTQPFTGASMVIPSLSALSLEQMMELLEPSSVVF